MKKMTRFLALILAFAMLSTVVVGAESGNSQGVYNIIADAGYTLTPLTAAGAAPTTHKETIDKEEVTVYEATEKFTLTFEGEGNVQYVVFLLSPGETVPKEGNIHYIDQKAGSETVNFTLYPDDITTPGKYGIYLSSSEDAYEEIATFVVSEPPYLLGDVDLDGSVTAVDASLALQDVAQLIELTGLNLAAAKVIDGETLTALDASFILQKVAKMIDSFPLEQ